MNNHYDAIIIGSGAGGCAAAYHLTQTGRSVLLLERGGSLPSDGSTLDVERVLRLEQFKCQELWLDGSGKQVVPGEFANLGGKTKWYGAALLRFSPHEFGADAPHHCFAWPLSYSDLQPFYDEAEHLLGVRTFPPEPDLLEIMSGLQEQDPAWHRKAMPLGLSANILQDSNEASHFDGFALASGNKADGETALLARVRQQSNLHIITGAQAMSFTSEAGHPEIINGVLCADGRQFHGAKVLLAAGALHSPRLLQTYLEKNGLAQSLPSYPLIGRYYKHHLNSALMAFSSNRKTDLLRKTAILLNDAFPHSSVQALGGSLAGEIVETQLPKFVPAGFARFFGQRAYGFFATTEDGSHPDNRVLAKANGAAFPQLDYQPERLPEAWQEHLGFIRALRRGLLKQGFITAVKHMPLEATAHALGTLIAGRDPSASVVDCNGKVHGMENLFVVDGSALPRSSRVNPALTIYAWALRVASRLDDGDRETKR